MKVLIIIVQIFDILKSRVKAWMSDSILVDKHSIQVHINFIKIVDWTWLFIFNIVILITNCSLTYENF